MKIPPPHRKTDHLSRWLSVICTALVCSVGSAQEGPFTTLPYSPSLNLDSMDPSAVPCEDLYQYACGGWIRNNPIPSDQSRISTYGKLYVDNQRYLWGILEELSQEDPGRNANQKMIGDYFAACMNVEAIDQAGLEPLQAALKSIRAIEDKNQLGQLIGDLIALTDSSSFFIALGSDQDARQSDVMIGTVYARGLGLPDRDYYVADDPQKKENREHYVRHVTRMFRLLGQDEETAGLNAVAVMRIETALAEASLTVVERRDPHKVYNRKTLGELEAIVPAVNWKALFAASGMTPEPWLNVMQPKFMGEIQTQIEQETLDDLKAYLTWGLINSRADLLSAPFRDQDFAFYSAYLEGIDEQKPRWRTCVSMIDNQLGKRWARNLSTGIFHRKFGAR